MNSCDASVRIRVMASSYETSRSLIFDTPHAVGPIWTSYQADADLYLTLHNNHKRQTPKPPMGFEPKIPASQRPHTYVLDRTATEIILHTYVV
jgi:hypothetical protein